MPARSFNQPVVRYPAVFTGEQCAPLPDVQYVYNNVPIEFRLGSYTADTTERFHARKASGELLPYKAYRRFDFHFESDVGYVSNETKVSCSGTPTWLLSRADVISGPHLFTTEGVPVNRENLWENPFDLVDCEVLAIEALASIAPDLDALTSLLEAHKTVAMILQARKRAKRLISEALKGGKRTAQAAAEAWLEWRYGWRILHYDMKAAEKALKEPILPRIITGSSGESFTQSLVRTDLQGYNGPERTQVRTVNIAEDVSIRVHAAVKVKHSTLNVLMDVPTTAWELVPFSFVADWFVSVGDCLAAWSVLRKAENTTMSLGYKRTMQIQARNESSPGYDTTNYRNGSGFASSRERYEDKVRIPIGVPSLIPQARVRLTSANILDAAALCKTRIYR